MSLGSEIWSALPLEILAMIMLATDDPETLDSWKLATAQNHMLARALIRSQWRETTIDEYDLVPVPGEDAELAARKAQSLLEGGCPTRGESRLVGIFNATPPGDAVLSYVEHLTISFLFWYFRDDRFRRIRQASYCLPSGETVEHTFDRLRPTLTRVREVTLEGRVNQAMLDMVTSMPSAPMVRNLSVERCGVWGFFDYRGFLTRIHRPAAEYTLSFDCIGAMSKLRCLEVCDLREEEIDGLAVAVSQLKTLESLTIQERDLLNPAPLSANTPLVSFMSSLARIGSSKSTAERGDFPASMFSKTLRSLKMLANANVEGTVSNHGSSSLEGDPKRYILESDISCLDIKNLDLLLNPPLFATDLLSALSPPGLQTLTLSSRHIGSVVEHEASSVTSRRYHYYHDLVRPHAATLRTLRITGAWDACLARAPAPFAAGPYSFRAQELTLGLQPAPFYAAPPPFARRPELLWHGLFGHPALPGARPSAPWAPRLRRLRLDHVAARELEAAEAWVAAAEGSTAAPFRRLRVLMLRPGPPRSRAQLRAGVAAPAPGDPGSRIPHADRLMPRQEVLEIIDAPTGRALAARLLPLLERAGFTALRVLVVGRAHLWIARPGAAVAGGRGPPPVLWDLGAALRDARQAARIERGLGARDWAFLADGTVPCMEARARHLDMMHLANPHSAEPEPQMQPQRWMHERWNVVGVHPMTAAQARGAEEEEDVADAEELGWGFLRFDKGGGVSVVEDERGA